MILPSVRNPRLSVLIRGVYSRLAEFQYIGAGTGTQFTEEGHTNDGVALAMIKNVHFTLGTGHGWIPFGEPMLITRIEGHRIYELDGQPAATRFRNAIRQVAKQDAELIGSNYQLGIPCGNGDYIIRNIISSEDEALVCVTAFPSKSMVNLMTTSVLALPAIAKRITEETLIRHPHPRFAFLFDGISRERLLKENVQESRIFSVPCRDYRRLEYCRTARLTVLRDPLAPQQCVVCRHWGCQRIEHACIRSAADYGYISLRQ